MVQTVISKQYKKLNGNIFAPVVKTCFLFFLDYVRLILNLAAFYLILSKPFLTVALHFTGGIVLDVLDGILARYLNQCK